MLSHLRELEAESIHVIREVAAEFARPVLLYSIGKDSQVLLHLARKAFHPAPVPFPLLHVDTTWKFREMYAFRDRIVRELGLRPVVERQGSLLGVDAERFRLARGEVPRHGRVRSRPLGCSPLSAAIESDAATVAAIIAEMRSSRRSERQGRLIDHDEEGSMETKKREGYF